MLPFLTIQRQRCIKIVSPKDTEFYTRLALNCQKGQQLSALEVYKSQSPIAIMSFGARMSGRLWQIMTTLVRLPLPQCFCLRGTKLRPSRTKTQTTPDSVFTGERKNLDHGLSFWGGKSGAVRVRFCVRFENGNASISTNISCDPHREKERKPTSVRVQVEYGFDCFQVHVWPVVSTVWIGSEYSFDILLDGSASESHTPNSTRTAP